MPFVLLALGFVRAHPRITRAFACLGALLGAFAFGRFSAPKPEVRTVDRVEYRDRVVTQVVEKKAEAKTETRTVVVYRDRVRRPDGTVETKEKVQEVSGATEHEIDDTTTAKTDDRASTSTSIVTVHTPEPRGFLTLGLGVPVALRAPFVGAPFVSVGGGYRVLGPFFLWGEGSTDLAVFAGKAPLVLTFTGGLGVSF